MSQPTPIFPTLEPFHDAPANLRIAGTTELWSIDVINYEDGRRARV